MADRAPVPLSQRVSAVLPFALPVLGGLIGVAVINMTAHGNPILGIGIGVLGGWGLARVLVMLLNR